MIRSIRKREWNHRGDTVRLPSMHTSGSLHLGLHLMCFCVRGSSQKRHSVWRHLPGAVDVCVCVWLVMCVRKRRDKAMKWVAVAAGVFNPRGGHMRYDTVL